MLRMRLTELNNNAAIDESHIRQVDNRLMNAEMAFRKLRKISGLKTSAEIVEHFVANEDENYSLFNYIQTTNDDIEKEMERLEHIKRAMKRYEKEQKQSNEHLYGTINSLKEKRKKAIEQNRISKGKLAELLP